MKKSLLITIFFVAAFINASHTQTLQLVKETNSAGNSYPWQLTISNNKLFFIAADETGLSKLWVTDGTTAGTLNLGPANGVGIFAPDLTAFNNKIYFACTGGNDNDDELWVSDGTAAGTKLFADIYPGSTGSFPHDITAANGRLFFVANDAVGDDRLYVSDGTAAGTALLSDKFRDAFNGASRFVVYKNNILFTGENSTNDGYALWKGDGTAAGTVLIKDNIVAGPTGPSSSELNGKLYLAAGDDTYGTELWVTDGTTGGTHLVKNIAAADGGGVLSNSNPQSFITYNNKVYFSASDGTHGQELWSTDGTAAGTVMVKDIVHGATGSLPYANTVFNNKLYFATWQTNELWVSNGTENGTKFIKAIPDAAKFAATFNSTMYLISGSSTTVYQSDGTAAGTVQAHFNNTPNSVYHYYETPSDLYFLPYKDGLYFQGSCAGIANGFDLVKITSGALPVRLISFTGERDGKFDKLEWKTATETNTASYIIEQSGDSKLFTSCGSVAAAGNSSVTKNYSFTQNAAANPGGFYRLKILDKDGRLSYSSVILLNKAAPGITAVYDASSKQVTIYNMAQHTCNWQLVNGDGKVIAKGSTANAVISIPVNMVAAGVYYLQYAAQQQKKLIKLGVF